MLTRTVLALVAAFAGLPDIAPDPVPRAGMALAPRKATAVCLAAETVRISLGEDTAKVEAVFTMENTSTEREELEVGFPRSAQPQDYTWSSNKGMEVKRWGPATIHDFAASVDGAEVKASPKLSPVKGEHMGWLCWSMAFEGSQKRKVEVRYTVNTRDDNYSDPSPLLNRQVTYVLKTGAGWKGNIGEAIIELHLNGMTADQITRAAPDPTSKEKSTWTWRMTDFKPNADVLIQYHVYAGAKEAVEKLAGKIKANGADVESWLDYAENLVALDESAKAAEAFAKLHELEKLEDRHLFRHRSEYRPPAYLAAKFYRQAGKKDEAREWSKKAVEALERVQKENEFQIRKFLHTTRETLAAAAQECRAWAEE